MFHVVKLNSTNNLVKLDSAPRMQPETLASEIRFHFILS